MIGPSPSDLSVAAAFRIFPIAHKYDMRPLLLWCGNTVDKTQLQLWPSAPIASSKVHQHPGFVQWLALADAKQSAPLIKACLAQLTQLDANGALRGSLASPRLRKLMDGLRSETKTDIMCRMAGLPQGFQVCDGQLSCYGW